MKKFNSDWIDENNNRRLVPVRVQEDGENSYEFVDRPVIVCLCGSTRFMEAWQKANLDLTLEGFIVLSIGCNTKSDADLQRMGELTDEKKAELDELHKRKIDLCDRILVLNVGGYIGSSTRSEIEYATKRGKPIFYLEEPAK